MPSDDSDDPDWLILEDGPLIAVNKPAGLLTEGIPDGHATMVGAVKDWLKQKYEKPGNVYLGIPHRLDRASTGVLVFTRNSKTAARVAEQFEKREVTKIYWALLESTPEPASGTLTDWLRKIPDEARTEIAEPHSPGAKESRLNYRVLSQFDGTCLVEIELLTGRMHQIRVQFSSRGCPVVGDDKYGAAPWPTDASQSATPNAESSDIRIALHARSLTLKHPIRYDSLTIEASLPDHWPVKGVHEVRE
jgi:23S rRNA pseudouridine1911/1915/1917 synthase